MLIEFNMENPMLWDISGRSDNHTGSGKKYPTFIEKQFIKFEKACSSEKNESVSSGNMVFTPLNNKII